MRVTAFLGAGASLEIGGPLASNLTCTVRNKKQRYYDSQLGRKRKVSLLGQITNKLNEFYSPNTCNFEDIFHVLEMLESYGRGWRDRTASTYKPPIAAFLKPRFTKFFDSLGLIVAKRDLLEIVAEAINSYDSIFDSNGNHRWFASFWQEAIKKCPWDIATLNYDTCIEKSIGVFEDGFEDTGDGYSRFNPRKLYTTSISRLLHLHGCILYGYPRLSDPNKYIYEDDFEDLYKFDTYDEAKKTWFGRSNNTAQSHEETIIGPIITGLRKTDKLISYPYSEYSTTFSKSIFENERLLIAGYSFGDLHFNKILEKIVRLHGNNRKIVIITWFDNRQPWHPDPGVMDWPGNEMFRFIAKSFKESNPFKSFSFNSPIVSIDGCVQLYLCGFKDAVDNHGRDIIDFLTQ